MTLTSLILLSSTLTQEIKRETIYRFMNMSPSAWQVTNPAVDNSPFRLHPSQTLLQFSILRTEQICQSSFGSPISTGNQSFLNLTATRIHASLYLLYQESNSDFSFFSLLYSQIKEHSQVNHQIVTLNSNRYVWLHIFLMQYICNVYNVHCNNITVINIVSNLCPEQGIREVLLIDLKEMKDWGWPLWSQIPPQGALGEVGGHCDLWEGTGIDCFDTNFATQCARRSWVISGLKGEGDTGVSPQQASGSVSDRFCIR